MTIFDYLVLLVLVCSVVISMLRGLVKELLSLAGWVIAFIVANAYGEALTPMLPDVFPGASTKLIVAFIALFIGTRLLMGLLSRALQELVKAGGLSLIDRALGALFGLVRGLLIVLAVVMLCATTSIPQQPFWKDALFSPWAEQAVVQIAPYLPGQLMQHVHF